MGFVPIKSEGQQEVQALHQVREQLLKSRTALLNQVRGLLAEHGIVAPQGIARARRLLLEILADPGCRSWRARWGSSGDSGSRTKAGVALSTKPSTPQKKAV